MRLAICDTTNFFHLKDFLREYKDILKHFDYQVVNNLPLIDTYYETETGIDMYTRKACTIEVETLDELNKLITEVNEKDGYQYLWLDLPNRLLILTAYLPDD